MMDERFPMESSFETAPLTIASVPASFSQILPIALLWKRNNFSVKICYMST
jgi:hypothetical protein